MATVSVRYIVDDVDAAITFYREQLGFSEVMHPAPTFAMLTRGDEVRLESGSSVEMLLQRPLDLDLNRIDPTARNTSPTPQRYRRLEKPSTNSPSTPGIPRV